MKTENNTMSTKKNAQKAKKTNRKSGMLKKAAIWLKNSFMRCGAFGRFAYVAVAGYLLVYFSEITVLLAKTFYKNAWPYAKLAVASPVFWCFVALGVLVGVATAIANYGRKQYNSGARHAHATHANQVPKQPKQSKQIEVPVEGTGMESAQPETDQIQ